MNGNKATFDPAKPEERFKVFDRLSTTYKERKKWHKIDWRLIGIKEGDRGLDVGCGSGAFSFDIQRSFNNSLAIYGIDSADDFVCWAIDIGNRDCVPNVFFQCCDLEKHLKSAKKYKFKYDFVRISQLIFGLGDLQKTIKKLKSLLKPGGILIIEDINLDQFKILPSSQDWDRLIIEIQDEILKKPENRHNGRELILEIHKAGLKDIQTIISTRCFELDRNSFPTLHTFMPSDLRDETELRIKRNVAKADLGFTEMVLVYGKV